MKRDTKIRALSRLIERDAAPLAELVRTGDPMATRLAFDLARKVRRGATVPTDADGIPLHLPDADPLTIV